jgi:hypothetical protein
MLDQHGLGGEQGEPLAELLVGEDAAVSAWRIVPGRGHYTKVL